MVACTPFEMFGSHVLPAHGSTCPKGCKMGKGRRVDAACCAGTQRQGPEWCLTRCVVTLFQAHTACPYACRVPFCLSKAQQNLLLLRGRFHLLQFPAAACQTKPQTLLTRP